MEAVRILKSEHGLIKQYLGILDRGLKAMEWADGETPPPEFFEKALDFAREFADRHHHYKEELVLFAKLAEKKEGQLDSAVERLRQQHEHGRDYLAAASQALSGYARGETVPAKELHFNLTRYLQNLRTHIQIEEDEFFDMAVDSLTAQEKEYLDSEFERLEREAGEDFQDHMRQQINLLNALLQ